MGKKARAYLRVKRKEMEREVTLETKVVEMKGIQKVKVERRVLYAVYCVNFKW